MDEQAIENEQHPLDMYESESKSPVSQESGLCSTMLVTEESLGSLDELSESVHQQLDSHIDQAAMLQYEVDLLRTQLAQKNRVITTQQVTIKQLQEALLASQREVKEIKCSAQNEITCKNETINILQSDLVDCQQQYAECFQQVVQQDRVLADIREDDTVLIQKIAFLEKQLRKASHTVSTQTESALAQSSPIRPHGTSQEFFTPHSQLRATPRSCNPRTGESRRSLYFETPNVSTIHCATPEPISHHRSPSPMRTRSLGVDVAADPIKQIQQLKDMIEEIRGIQSTLQPITSHQEQPAGTSLHRRTQLNDSELSEEFWNAIAEERQQRIKLDHIVRQMELDLLEVKNQVQSCKARIASQQDTSHLVCHNSTKVCCPLMEQALVPPAPRSSSNSSTTFYTLV